MGAFRIGRIFGIDLRVDWSWVVICILLTWNLVAVFARWHPDWSGTEALGTALVAALAFFACILVHELAHSLVAMAFGVRVRSITLFLFGGVSNIEQEPPSAVSELLIAIVGPITSIMLGLLFAAMATLLTPILSSNAPVNDVDDVAAVVASFGPVTTLLVWLGPINLMIGLFNLLPGFPLDGGRVLRALLWKVTGNFRTATRLASSSGQLLGWLFIGCGIAMTFGARVPFFGTGFGSGLWLAFIGWFLRGAAAQAATKLALDDAFAGMTVEQLMQRHGPVATPDLSVATLVHQHIVPGEDRGVPVVQRGELVGLVSISDIRALAPEAWASTPVSEIMRGFDSLTVATPDEPLLHAFEELAQRDIDQLPVVLGRRLVGMLRRRDVARWLELAWRPNAANGRSSHPHDSGIHTRPA